MQIPNLILQLLPRKHSNPLLRGQNRPVQIILRIFYLVEVAAWLYVAFCYGDQVYDLSFEGMTADQDSLSCSGFLAGSGAGVWGWIVGVGFGLRRLLEGFENASGS